MLVKFVRFDGTPIYIESSAVVAIAEENNLTRVSTNGGATFGVRHQVDEVVSLVQTASYEKAV